MDKPLALLGVVLIAIAVSVPLPAYSTFITTNVFLLGLGFLFLVPIALKGFGMKNGIRMVVIVIAGMTMFVFTVHVAQIQAFLSPFV